MMENGSLNWLNKARKANSSFRLLAEQVHFICHSKKAKNQIEYEIPLVNVARTFVLTCAQPLRGRLLVIVQFHFGTLAGISSSILELLLSFGTAKP